MRALTANECIAPAIERTRELLFRPFAWRTFLKLTSVALFAELSGISFSYSNQGRMAHLPGLPPAAQAAILSMLVGLAMVIFIVGLILFYIGSRLQFVLVEIVATRQTTVAPIWARYSRLTWRWIGFKLLLFVVLLFFCAVALIPAFLLVFRDVPPGLSPLQAITFSHLFLFIGAMCVAILAWTALYFLFRDFALPFIALEGLGISAALSRLKVLVVSDLGQFALYIVLRVVLSLFAAIVAYIAVLFTLGISLIPFGVIGGILWFALHSAGAGGTAILVGCLIVEAIVYFLWALFVGIGLIGTVFIFGQAFALYFLGGRYPTLGNILEPPPIGYYVPPPAPTENPYPGAGLPPKPDSI